MALLQMAQFGIEGLFFGAGAFAAASLTQSIHAALPRIARLRGLAAGEPVQPVQTQVRTVRVQMVPARTAEVRELRPALRLRAAAELRAAA